MPSGPYRPSSNPGMLGNNFLSELRHFFLTKKVYLKNKPPTESDTKQIKLCDDREPPNFIVIYEGKHFLEIKVSYYFFSSACLILRNTERELTN